MSIFRIALTDQIHQATVQNIFKIPLTLAIGTQIVVNYKTQKYDTRLG